VPALAVALISSGSTGLDSLNQGLNLVRVGAVLGCGCGSGAVRLRDEQGSVRAAAHRPLDCGLTRTVTRCPPPPPNPPSSPHSSRACSCRLRSSPSSPSTRARRSWANLSTAR
jgi:hypothetical protein